MATKRKPSPQVNYKIPIPSKTHKTTYKLKKTTLSATNLNLNLNSSWETLCPSWKEIWWFLECRSWSSSATTPG